MRCFRCGTVGHIEAGCPYTPADLADASAPRRPWCGNCDKSTRLIDHGDHVARCAECHPLGYKPLAQHKRCGGCGKTIYEWERQPCGSHQGENPGPNKAYTERGLEYWQAKIRELVSGAG